MNVTQLCVDQVAFAMVHLPPAERERCFFAAFDKRPARRPT